MKTITAAKFKAAIELDPASAAMSKLMAATHPIHSAGPPRSQSFQPPASHAEFAWLPPIVAHR